MRLCLALSGRIATGAKAAVVCKILEIQDQTDIIQAGQLSGLAHIPHGTVSFLRAETKFEAELVLMSQPV